MLTAALRESLVMEINQMSSVANPDSLSSKLSPPLSQQFHSSTEDINLGHNESGFNRTACHGITDASTRLMFEQHGCAAAM